ncbi:MAG: aminotransferase class V-fold PLP-dependent enzyme [Candidatus Sedimenticola sp. (ex Thyasira tokunagai)]
MLTNLTPELLRKQTIGIDNRFTTPFGERMMVYADYTASGRGLHFIEDYLKQLQQCYANSHTEDDSSGRFTTQMLHLAEQRIKKSVNAGSAGRLIVCGHGATAAIDRMQQLVGVKHPAPSRAMLNTLLRGFAGADQAEAFDNYCQAHQPVVFVGPYEHHSNEISWRESLATVREVGLAADGSIDLAHLETLLNDPAYQGRLRIGSFSAASNVTGMRSPVSKIARLLHRYNALAFFDYAACAPYVEIDMNPPADEAGDASLDAVFISPHKFLGGPGSSGVLLFNSRCYHSELPPSIAGGGTVDYVGPEGHDFVENIEARESAGTPGILQTIKAALAFEVKEAVGVGLIEARELEMIRQGMQRWESHPYIEILGNPDPQRRIGIISFNILGRSGSYLHPRFVTTLLNDLFGIQTRAGCSCAGPYGHQLLGINDEQASEFRAVIAEGHCGIKPGWCRLGFHYTFDKLEVEYILDAVDFVGSHGYLFLEQYRFEHDSGAWQHKDWQDDEPTLSLYDALQATAVSPEPETEHSRAAHYQENLERAGELAQLFKAEHSDESVQLGGEEGELQFFQLPRESMLK